MGDELTNQSLNRPTQGLIGTSRQCYSYREREQFLYNLS